jgi:hypothetical protein
VGCESQVCLSLLIWVWVWVVLHGRQRLALLADLLTGLASLLLLKRL